MNKTIDTFTLRTPIKAPNGDPLRKLALREPTARDIRELGLPYTVEAGRGGQGGGMRFDTQVIARYIERLGGVTMTDIDTLHPLDFNDIVQAVVAFFGGSEAKTEEDTGEETSSTGTLTSSSSSVTAASST
jgi:hypothetical protein